ncbi:hypothetical protein HELRODRAFT_164122 [Helobdella robusta]|uniref:Uncharacterized protein n=1 Tax=Helobdella robusta TaxID=6412 RepID=T1EUY6_HELRO|nr:hypothetical protein HELRODRAFT_164122 [Helobdella robusta]ESN94305.1 hypothetical protein HELRODRAFT_164122 [Helobdella robusta]
MFKSLKTTVPDVEINKSENELQQFQHTTTSSATPNPLPVKPKTSTNQNCVIKQLKKKLKNLKILGRNNNSFNNEIIAVSKLIRSKLHYSRRQGKSDVSIQLSKNFWKACKKIFSLTTTPPSFDVEKESNFFYSTMEADDKCYYNIPDWIPSLPLPLYGSDVGPQTYETVSNIVEVNLAPLRVHWIEYR